MNSLFRRIRDALAAIVLLIIPFFFLNANLKNPSQTSSLDRIILRISAPVQYLASELASSVSFVWENYIYLVDVRREGERLQRENDRLRFENSQLWVARRENERLRALLDLRARLPVETVSASIISKEISPYFRVVRVRLDRGADERIRPGMPVLSSDGLVGEIRRTWGGYSDVVLTVDRTSAVDIVIPRSGARGILRGLGSFNNYLCHVQYLLRTDDVRKGDRVYTSGLGYKFPAGILVGTVSAIKKKTFGLYQEVEVVPAVNFSHLEEATVMLTTSLKPLVEDNGSQN